MKSVFQLTHTQSQRELIKGMESGERKQGSGETERERKRVCVRVLIKTDDSVDQHPQTVWDKETHLAIIDSRHL